LIALGLGEAKQHLLTVSRHGSALGFRDQANLKIRELKETKGWKTMQTAMRSMHAREKQQQEKLQEISTSQMKRLQGAKVGP
jgi:hypothetical protein